jgi:hypothetical protein
MSVMQEKGLGYDPVKGELEPSSSEEQQQQHSRCGSQVLAAA